MTVIIRKLTSLAIAFTVVCLVAASFPQFNVVFPPPVMASTTTVVPNLQHASDTTGDTLSGIIGDDATENPDVLSKVDINDNVYTADQGDAMYLDGFNVIAIPDGSTITTAVLHLQYGAEDGYLGTSPVRYDNGGGLTTTGITPTDITGWSADLTFDLYAAGVNTKTEIQDVDIEFFNNDIDTPNDAIHFDYVWISVTHVTAIDRAANQGITITDGVTATPVTLRGVAQGITVSDGVATAFEGGRDASQGITISDGVTTLAVTGRDASQGITITDGVTATFARGRNVSQGITISDGVTVIAASGRNINQGITISDGVTAGIVRSRDASQTITISDGVTATAASGRNVSQGITISDGVTATPTAYRPVAQGITVSDGATADVGRGRNINQGITISDGVTATAGSTRNVNQGITISDGVSHCCERSPDVNQGITISDGVTAVPAAYRPVAQGITISDGVTATAASGRNANQGITISDGVTATPAVYRPVAQGITISDGVTAVPVTLRDAAQGITISDGVTATFEAGGGGGGGGGWGGGVPPAVVTVTETGSVDLTAYIDNEGNTTVQIVLTSTDGQVIMTIPLGTRMLDAQGNPLDSLEIILLSTPPPPPGYTLVGPAYDCLPDGVTFEPAFPLTFTYDTADIPEGVTEENLVIAMWDEDAGQWVELPSTVDPLTHTITASVSHFTTFAIIARAPAVPPPAPATFSLSNLSIQPVEVQPEEAVTITVLVVNTGGTEGSYTAVLKIEGVKEAEKKVTVAAGDSRSVSFSVSREDAGSYSVAVAGLSGSFTIVALPAAPVAPALNWPLVGGIVAAVWGLLIFWGRRKISPLAHATLPKLRVLVALLVAVRLKITPFIRRIISSLARTAWPKLRALVALLAAVRLKIAPFIRRIISSLTSRVKH